ncbi:MAG: flagellin biosynthesis protein FlgE [Deltaproteobacteria bacterium]|nr:MAG: flagellin biosynthesis protein FlgE [Deltaproteobacteria bacterium]
MSLTSSLFTGTSGLKNLGNAMQVIGDNISNVNTVGFKGNRYTFADLLSQSVATQSGSAQVGRGMAMGSVDVSFIQGSFESTGNATDLSIGGDGFFVVRQDGTERNYYTRAGNFNFDKDGYLVNPEGYIVQGWLLDEETGDDIGSVSDILLRSFTSPPKATDEMSVITNLDATMNSLAEVLTNTWDGLAEDTQISANGYEYQTVVKVYDSLGSTHDLTVYYDKKEDNKWEYMVCCNPTEDMRNQVQETAGLGLLAQGTFTFNSNGSISDMTMSRFTGRIGNVRAPVATGINQEGITFNILNNDAIPSDGYNFGLQYNGATNSWNFADLDGDGNVDVPAAYNAGPPTATVLASDQSTVQIDLNDDGSMDLEIKFDTDAIDGDQILFDINDPVDIHVQRVLDLTYDRTAGNNGVEADNTTMRVPNPGAMLRSTAAGDDFQLNWDGAGNWTIANLPAAYNAATAYVDASATITGDKDSLSIDLNADGTVDIKFDFEESLSVTPGSITFGIQGSTAWETLTTDDVNTNGFYELEADFLGGGSDSTVMKIAFDAGTRYDGSDWINDSLSTTQYSRKSSTIYQAGNGYGAGDLQGVDVSADGEITGIYSNGQLIPLFRVALARFQNNQGLYKEGGNLYSETRDSGSAITNRPGENGLGNISPNSLEMSNVDIADEFVDMITTQRGFQANSKIVTTVDSMLSDVIQMKR